MKKPMQTTGDRRNRGFAPQEMEVQPQGETETGRVVVEAARSKRQSSARRSCRYGRKLIAGRQGDV